MFVCIGTVQYLSLWRWSLCIISWIQRTVRNIGLFSWRFYGVHFILNQNSVSQRKQLKMMIYIIHNQRQNISVVCLNINNMVCFKKVYVAELCCGHCILANLTISFNIREWVVKLLLTKGFAGEPCRLIERKRNFICVKNSWNKECTL